ncbi:MAG: valine--tRNA ligase [Rickettsiales bacterium]|jgi:valyl-tRNA synthetase
MKQLPKNYDHQKSEKNWQEHWVEQGTYHWRDDLPREQTFVIDTPPPTVSGVLHMGHIFSYTQADFIARYQRMSGRDVFYPMGFDDNGLPTERLVEKVKKVRGNSMPRAEFVALCREVVKDAEEDFRTLFKSAALSVDWRQEYQTISDDVRKISQASFIDLLQKNEAYRDFRPTYWDWVDGTAIAQAEIENKEMAGVMNEIEFTLDVEVAGEPSASGAASHVSDSTSRSGDNKIVIMTTRPELLGACVAVMYHPEDDNAGKYKGKYAITPLFGVKVPMIADEAVEREKGTGLVMCCTFGDDTDKDWWRKHKLPMRNILGSDGRVNTYIQKHERYIAFTLGSDDQLHNILDTPVSSITALHVNDCICFDVTTSFYETLQGLKPKQANAKIIELLQAEGKLLKQTPMMHTVKCAERSGTPIEIIPTHQWFIRVADKKEALLAKGAEVKWYPQYMQIRLNQWIEGLKEDWCISRQRFFGVPIPVWYSKRAGEEGKIIYAEAEQLPVDPMIDLPKGYTRDEVTADKDILDTWATSSISPQINAQSIGSSSVIFNSSSASRYAKLFPADLRPQAHEIIRTWAFYTIAKAHLHANTIPWKNIIISGWCLASDKTKMSKSKGNVVTPVALIEEKGTDAVRYWASTSRLGTDTAFSEDLLKIGRKLVNKLWNASQFAALNLDKIQGAPTTASADAKSGIISESLDLWILSRLNQCINKATKAFEVFEYCDARVAIEDFFWNDFCDNYLELVKARAYGENAIDISGQQSALYAIHHCLEAILRLFAPFVPHITEELYSHIFEEKYAKLGSIHARGNWLKADDYPYIASAEKSGMAAVDVLNVIRKAKSEASLSIKFPVDEVQVSAVESGATWEDLVPVLADLKAAGNAQSIIPSSGGDLPYLSEQGWFRVSVKLGAAA